MPPASAASRASRRQGNVSRSGASKVSAPSSTRSSVAHRHVGAVRVVQRVGDRHAHVRIAQVGERGAVVQVHHRVDDRLRVHHHVDPVVGDAEQVVRLDQLEALVHQRGRVDRDLPAHVPGRVGERLLAGHRVELACGPRNGPAAGGEHQPVDRARAARPRSAGRARSARSPRGAAGRPWPRRARSPARRPPRGSPCWPAPGRCPRPARPPSGPSPAEPTSAFSTRSQSVSVISSTSPSGPARTSAVECSAARAAASGSASAMPRTRRARGLLEQQLPARRRGEAHHLELGVALDHVERLGPDRAGRADYQDPAHRPECRVSAYPRPHGGVVGHRDREEAPRPGGPARRRGRRTACRCPSPRGRA